LFDFARGQVGGARLAEASATLIEIEIVAVCKVMSAHTNLRKQTSANMKQWAKINVDKKR
jgi:hypothetical protein